MNLTKKRRLALQKVYNGRYSRHYSSRAGCFYCGQIGTTLDHCPPIAFCDDKNFDWFKERKIGFYLVNSCNECNQKLSNKPLFYLEERAEFILKCLELKADKAVIWGDDEIQEMSKTFQKMIIARKLQQNVLFDRIRFCQELLTRQEDFPA